MRANGVRVEALLQQVITELQAGRLQQARALCERGLSEVPAVAQAPLQQMMAVLCMQAGQAQSAREHIAASLAQRPGHVPSLKIAGDAALAAGDVPAARGHYEQAATLQPDRADIWVAFARTLQDGRADAAARAQAWARVAALLPSDPEPWLQLANARQDLGDLPGAIEALRVLLRIAPQHAVAEVNLGIALQESGQLEAALRAYGRAYRLSEDTFGRIAHALSTPRVGRLWLDLDALRTELRALPD